MAKCIQCGGRANKAFGCPGCNKGPLCLKCSCACRWWEKQKLVVVAGKGAKLVPRSESSTDPIPKTQDPE